MNTGDRGATVTVQEILAVFANVDEEVLRTGDVARELSFGSATRKTGWTASASADSSRATSNRATGGG